MTRGLDYDYCLAAAEIVSLLIKAVPEKAERVKEGVMNINIRVDTNVGSYVVRMYPIGREGIFKFEPGLIKRMAQHGMRVPTFVGSSEHGPPSKLPYLVYEWRPGRTMQACATTLTQVEIERIFKQVAAQLIILESMKVSGYGELNDKGSGRYSDWRQWIRSDLAAAVPALSQMKIPMPIPRVAEYIDIAAPPLMPSLSWGDLSCDNIIVDDGNNFVGLVDFEGVLAAEPMLVRGYFLARYHGSPLANAMMDAWPIFDELEMDRVIFYALLRGLRLMPYLSQKLPGGARRDPLNAFLPGFQRAIEWFASTS